MREERVNLQAILDRLEGKHTLIIGDVMLDQYLFGNVTRISPEAPVPVLDVTDETCCLGGAANVAHNVASLGGRVVLMGVIGDDRNGATLKSMLGESQIHPAGLQIDPTRPTTTKTRVIALSSSTSPSTHQQMVRIDRESKRPIPTSLRNQLLKAALSLIPQADAILFSDYDKGVISPQLIQDVLVCAQQCHKPVIVDPKVKNFFSYKGVTAMTPNLKEAGAALHREMIDEASFISGGEEIVERLNLQSLLITRGERGMSLFRRERDFRNQPPPLRVDHIRAHPRQVVDATGAGDTVVAVFTLALAAKADMLDAARLSNVAGGIVVEKRGCVAITKEELSQAIRLEIQDEIERSGPERCEESPSFLSPHTSAGRPTPNQESPPSPVTLGVTP